MKPVLALAALAALALAGCSGATNDGAGTTSTTAAAPPMEDGKYVIHLKGNKFIPANATIPAGSTVVWVVEDGVHDVTEGHDGDEWDWSSDDDLDSKMTKGDRYERKFDAKGDVGYRCIVHASAGMLGTLTVA